MILDTTFVIDVLNGDERAKQRRTELDERGDMAISSITVFELTEGAQLSNRTEGERRAITEFCSRLRAVPVDTEIATLAGELSATLIARGERIEAEDVFIGATALHGDEVVLTRNVEHFERLDGVEIETY